MDLTLSPAALLARDRDAVEAIAHALPPCTLPPLEGGESKGEDGEADQESKEGSGGEAAAAQQQQQQAERLTHEITMVAAPSEWTFQGLQWLVETYPAEFGRFCADIRLKDWTLALDEELVEALQESVGGSSNAEKGC